MVSEKLCQTDKLWNLEAHQFVRSKDVKFIEMKSAYKFEEFYNPEEEQLEILMPGETDAEVENLGETSSTLRRGPDRPRKLLTGRPRRPNKLCNMVNEYVTVVDNLDPGTVKEALQSPEANNWKAAIEANYQALKKNNIWTVTRRPNGKKVLKCK